MPVKCKICALPTTEAFKAQVLGKYEASYSYCGSCGFLCAENPYWLEEAYSSAIASTDTGLAARNIAIANKLAIVLYFLMGERGKGIFVDVAGGYGMLTRLMRDYGFDYYWSDKFCQNLMAIGFGYNSEIGVCQAVTAFEVLEHTEDPISFVEDALKYGKTDTFIFTTELYNDSPSPPDQWSYYSFETGQHIAFFQRRTLQMLANKIGLNFCSNGWIHIISKNKINEALLKAYTGRLSFFAIRWVRKKLSTRIMSDHDALVENLQRNNF